MKKRIFLAVSLLIGFLVTLGIPPVFADTITVALQSDGKTLDPHKASDAGSIHLIENMYSTLLRHKAGTYGEIEPDLAESYTISKDGRSYTFKLRKGARFHDSGREVKAADVKYSIERIIELKERAAHFSNLAGMDISDDYTIIFRLKEAMAPFLMFLANPMNAVVNKDVVTANAGNLDRADAGSGPFRLVEWKKDQHCILEKYQQYYIKGLPKLDKVIFRPIPDTTAQSTALRNGEVDIILDVNNKQALLLKKAGNVTLKNVPGTFWEYIGINTKHEPFDDVRVRQAVSYAIDRNIINKMVKFGNATVLDGGVLPPSHWAYANLHPYGKRDLAKARQLLKAAGLGNGFETVLKVGSDFEYQVSAAQIIKQQLKDVGIKVKVVGMESSLFFNSLGKHDFALTVVGWLGFIDPDEYFYNIFHSQGKWNQQSFANATFDQLLDQGRKETDMAKRKQIYGQIQQILVDEVPMAFLYMNPRITAYRDNVRGFDAHPTVTTISLRETSLK